MKLVNLFSILKSLNKSYYSFSELQMILDLGKLSTNKRLIDLQKQGFLTKLAKNIFVPVYSSIDEAHIANYLYQPSYLSFESALHFYGILNVNMDVITYATLGPSRTRQIGTKTIIWSKLAAELFFGYNKTNRFMVADPEKAYCDLLYMSSLGKGGVDELGMNWLKLDKKKIKTYLEKYPSYTKKRFDASIK